VVLTGLARNINHIVRGIAAHYISWYFPRGLQHAQKTIAQPVKLVTLDRLIPSEHYTQAQISPHFWANGKMPDREDSQQLAAGNFKEFRLRVGVWWRTRSNGSLEDLRAFGKDECITMHHCIQGWSGIAQWGGFSMKKLIEHVKPKPSARVIAFYSFGGSLYGVAYYDTQNLYNALKPECLLAYKMNGKPLTVVYGAPLRLRVENQLGYKKVKWIERIEFVESEKALGKGEGRQERG
jgi:methionine sulfoxide reductase catalytic subunit